MVRGVMNSVAPGVMTTRTSAPRRLNSLARVADLYAAMLPVRPSTMRRPVNMGSEGVEAKDMAIAN